MNEDTKPEHVFIHLNHPCWDIDIWVLDEPEIDIPLAKGQGYISLAELRDLKTRIAMLEERISQLSVQQ